MRGDAFGRNDGYGLAFFVVGATGLERHVFASGHSVSMGVDPRQESVQEQHEAQPITASRCRSVQVSGLR
jgi:hypothetical protein